MECVRESSEGCLGGQGKKSNGEKREAILSTPLPTQLLFSLEKCGLCLHYIAEITTCNPPSLPAPIFLTSGRTWLCWQFSFFLDLSSLPYTAQCCLGPYANFLLTCLSNQSFSCLQHISPSPSSHHPCHASS